jgi:hypothetical protein
LAGGFSRREGVTRLEAEAAGAIVSEGAMARVLAAADRYEQDLCQQTELPPCRANPSPTSK